MHWSDPQNKLSHALNLSNIVIVTVRLLHVWEFASIYLNATHTIKIKYINHPSGLVKCE
jgi:hypothetical protein